MPVDDSDAISALALAYRAGDRTVLEALHRAVQPVIRGSLARYRDQAGALPASIERADLEQEAWVILAKLARSWRPEGGSFVSYFSASFPWYLSRYVQRCSPSRRARGIQVFGAEQPRIQEALEATAGSDGREWDQALQYEELMQPLDERERAVLRLRFVEHQPFTKIAQQLRLTRPSVYRLYRSALRHVQNGRVRIGDRTVYMEARSVNFEREGELIDLVFALHEGANQGCLPGRAWLQQRTGLSGHRLSRLVGLLVEAGCVVDRERRKSGRLVHPTPAASLAALGLGPPVPDPEPGRELVGVERVH
ncbi:MAG: sigma-70 family RNA polymerase sigma factor [Chloroflexi bacterium]|nr:sigma-70 family RNA polymerase sigma factor [Chloroflexota bacterium]